MRQRSFLVSFGVGLAVICGLSSAPAFAQDRNQAQDAPKKQAARQARQANYPPQMPDAKVRTYQSGGKETLNLYIFAPEDHKPTNSRPAIVFFFGGGWTNGSPIQFEPHCRYLASRGMVAITADYRVASRHRTKAADSVTDAKSAMRWVRAHAKELGADPHRIAAGGGSAGGHLAAASALLPGFDSSGEDNSTNSKPDALVLFNPAVVLAKMDDAKIDQARIDRLAARLGSDPKAISPAHHVTKDAPPTIVFHGRADETVPFSTIEAFAEKMKEAGARCEVAAYEGKGHGFFNVGRGGRDNRDTVRDTFRRMDAFLVSLGWLSGEPAVDEFFDKLNDSAPTGQSSP